MRKPPRLPSPRTLPTSHKRKAGMRLRQHEAGAASQTVAAHSYSPETGHLTVTFHGGRQYRYEGVDEATAKGLRDAESQGSYLHRHIIGKFDASKI